MKHVGCYVGQHSGLFWVVSKSVGERFEAKGGPKAGKFFVPVCYNLRAVGVSEQYFLDWAVEEGTELFVEGSKVKVKFDPESKHFPYKIQLHVQSQYKL